MIKLSARVSKKLPMPDVEYSSRSCSAGIEVEVAEGTNPAALQEKLKKLYGLLELAVDEQLNAPRNVPDRGKQHSSPFSSGSNGGNGRSATEAQVRAILAIASDKGIGQSELKRGLEREYGVEAPDMLNIRQASDVIDRLKNGKESRT